MQNKECSKNRGFREVQISIFTGSHVCGLELCEITTQVDYALDKII